MDRLTRAQQRYEQIKANPDAHTTHEGVAASIELDRAEGLNSTGTRAFPYKF